MIFFDSLNENIFVICILINFWILFFFFYIGCFLPQNNLMGMEIFFSVHETFTLIEKFKNILFNKKMICMKK